MNVEPGLNEDGHRELLGALVTGGLAPAQRADAERHVAGCASCASLRDEYERAFASLALTVSDVQPRAVLRERLLVRVARRSLIRRIAARTSALLRVPSLPPTSPTGGARVAVAFGLAAITVVSVVLSVALQRATPAAAAVLTVFGPGVERAGDGSAWIAATDYMALREGDAIRTTGAGHALITFADGTTITIEPRTEIRLAQTEPSGHRVDARVGRIWTSVGSSTMEITTPAGDIRTEGTAFETRISGDGTTSVAPTEGRVAFRAGQEVIVRSGERAVARPGGPVEVTTDRPASRLEVRSTAPFLVIDHESLACGRTADGSLVRQMPRCVPHDPSLVSLTSPTGGRFTVAVIAQHDGPVGVAARLVRPGRADLEVEATVDLGGGDRVVVELELHDGDLRIGSFNRVGTVPAKIVLATGDRSAPFAAPAEAPAPVDPIRSGTRAGTLMPTLAPVSTPRTDGDRTPSPAPTVRLRTIEPTSTLRPTATAQIRTPQPSTPRPTATARTPEPMRTPEPTSTD